MYDCTAALVMLIIFLVCSVIQLIEATLFHELGHLHVARKYEYTNAEIYLLYAFPMFKVRGCAFIKSKELKFSGKTELENNYQPYTDKQIVEIAKAGIIVGTLFIIACGLIELVIDMIIMHFFIKDENILCFGQFILISVIIFALSISALYMIGYFTAKSKWCDRNIVKDPAGFRKYAAEKAKERKENGTGLYIGKEEHGSGKG